MAALARNRVLYRVSARRVLAALEREIPLLFFTLACAVGLLLAWWPSISLGVSVGSALGAVFNLLRAPVRAVFRLRAAVFFGLVAGTLLGWMQLRMTRLPEAPVGSVERMVAQVLVEPRHRRVGESEFRMELLGGAELQPEVVAIAPRAWGGSRAYCTTRDLPWLNATNLRSGDLIILRAKFRRVEESINPFSYESYLRRGGVSASCKIDALEILSQGGPPSSLEILRTKLLRGLQGVLGDGEQAGFTAAMFLGHRDVLSDETEALFKRTGLAHLLVVSGMQVTLIGLLTSGAVRRLLGHVSFARTGRTAIVAVLFGTVVAFAYAELTGFDSASSRAATATAIAALSAISERGRSWCNALCASALVVLVLIPGAIFDPSIHLTFAALSSFLIARNVSPVLGLQMCCAVFLTPLVTGIVAWAWFGSFQLSGLWMNALFALPITLVSCHGSLLALLAWGSGLDSSGWLLRIVAWALDWLVRAIEWLDRVSPRVVTEENQIGFVVVGVLVVLAAVGVALREWVGRMRGAWVLNGARASSPPLTPMPAKFAVNSDRLV